MSQVHIKKERLGLWERYLTLWVALCIAAGIGVGRLFPEVPTLLGGLTVAGVSIPVAICLFLMIYPIMVQIDFSQVVKATRTPKSIITTLVANWAIKPFTMAFFAWLFLCVVFKNFLSPEIAQEYRAGMILLGVAPCTAMVLMWSHLAKGNMGHTLVMTAINSLSMVILYAPSALANTSLTVSPITSPSSPGYVGQNITLSGVDFQPNATITITYSTTSITVATTTSDASGDFSIDFDVPRSLAGAHTITASDGINSLQVLFYMEGQALLSISENETL